MITLVLLCLFINGNVNAKCLDQEPLDLVKSYLERPTPVLVETWQRVRELADDSPQSQSIKHAIDNMVQTRTVVKVVEDSYSVLSLPKGTELATTLSVPYLNTLTLMASSLNVLLDGFETEVVQKQLKDVELPDDLVIPKDLRHNTLLDLFNRVPRYNRKQIGLVNEMNIQGRTAFLVARNLLGRDEWQDAFTSIGMQNAVLSEHNDNIDATLGDVITFTQTLIARMKGEPLPSDKILKLIRGNNYAFGWWLNCEKGSCLVGVLPQDTIISFSPALRVYIIPSISTGFIISNTVQKTHNSRTMNDLLNFDSELFSRMLRVVTQQDEQQEEMSTEDETTTPTDIPQPPKDHDSQSTQDDYLDEDEMTTPTDIPQPPKGHDSQSTKDDDYLDILLGTFFRAVKSLVVLYMDFVASQHVIVRALLWVLFLLIAHLVTAWMYHGIWFVMCRLVKNTHEERPKRD